MAGQRTTRFRRGMIRPYLRRGALKPWKRKFRWPLGRRPDDHPSLSQLGL